MMNICIVRSSILILAGIVLYSGPQDAAAQNPVDLRTSLTLHASFEHGMNADFSRGDATIYSFSTAAERREGGRVGFPDNSVKIATGAGRYGNALLFTDEASFKPFFKNEGNVGYNPTQWSATVSVWLRLTPEFDLGPGYCDPVQIIGEDGRKGFIFLEFDKDPQPALKNPPPKYFRYSLLPIRENWNPDNTYWGDIPFEERPMVQVERAPFSRAKWTHVVFTLENVNANNSTQSGKLYIDGKLQGSIEGWDLTLGWDPQAVLLVLGHEYVGHMDELSVFDRALTNEEIQSLFTLEKGVGELY